MSKCTFTSEWSGGEVVTTNCEYNKSTGQVFPETSKDDSPTGELIREYITTDNDEEIEVCPDCHEFVMKDIIIDRNKCLTDDTECSDKLCCSNN